MQIDKITQAIPFVDRLYGECIKYFIDTGGMFESYIVTNKAGEFMDGTFYEGTDAQKQQMQLIAEYIKK